ncbi:MAG TPA: iron chelate uptake ABC transporter family permease subunit [Solirubrobacterales bacterium]|nr:iron chelate uptake ABC transporter family permease subunit [Solirubrobacterales bacterium]
MTSIAATAGATLARMRTRRRNRGVIAVIGLAGLALLLFVVSLALETTLVDVFAVLSGLSENAAVEFIVRDVRLPVAAQAVCVGCALGLAGTVFQRLLGNPLAAPELIGVSAGASLAAVAGIVLFAWGGPAISAAALAGALAGVALIYALAWRDGVDGYRMILIGIGVTELLMAVVVYLVARAEIHDARAAMHWLIGSTGQSGTGELYALIAALAILGPATLALDRWLRTVELGDDQARALGLGVERARLALIAVATGLVGFATAVAGPVAFVALVAGPVAQRLAGGARWGLVAAALFGACLMLAADLVARDLLPTPLPTGVVTGVVGAPYLLWVLTTSNRAGGAG